MEKGKKNEDSKISWKKKGKKWIVGERDLSLIVGKMEKNKTDSKISCKKKGKMDSRRA